MSKVGPPYWKLVSVEKGGSEECIGIIFDKKETYTADEWDVVDRQLSKELNNREWLWESITQPEFETYREFGIKEYKL